MDLIGDASAGVATILEPGQAVRQTPRVTAGFISHYRILAEIGAGGMGVVHRARDQRLNRDVAIKVLPADFVADADRLRRFEREAKALAALNHPNIMTVFDVGQHEGQPYLVSELLEGQTLREVLEGGPKQGLPVRKAAEYALQIAQGLSAAHGKGVSHRDLKPENLFVTKDGRVKILDFGLAKLGETDAPEVGKPIPAEDADAVTQVGQSLDATKLGWVLGTPSYMAPEQARGERVDHRSDLFAFGCVLFEMLSGKRPFKRDTAIATLAAVMNDEAPDLAEARPDLPPALARIAQRCLEKNPENRFQTAKDLAFALEGAGGLNAVPRAVPSESGERREEGNSPANQGERGGVQHGARWGWALLAIVAVIGAGWWIVDRSSKAPKQAMQGVANPSVATSAPPPAAADQKSIAVLPFLNMSADKDNEYFSDGITEEILNALARTPGLRVAARTSAFSFKGKNESMQRIGELLKVGVILEGSVRRSGSQLRITAQLINVEDGFHLWSDTFDRKAEDVFAIQSEVAQRVQEVLKVKLLAGTNGNASLAGTDNLEAYDLYLRGRQFWNKRTGADLERAVGLFEQATEKDPKFAAAYAGLAASYVRLPSYAAVSARAAIPKARAAANRALELDRRLAEAHAVIGDCAMWEWDWVAAEKAYRDALSLNPNASAGLNSYSNFLCHQGKIPEALAVIRKAQEMDPLSAIIQKNLGTTLFLAGRLEEALREIETSLKLTPDFVPGYVARGWIFLVEKRIPEAIAEFEKVWIKTGDTPAALGSLGHAYARAGRTNDARQILEKLKSISNKGINCSYEIALVHLGLGEPDQAFVWLERTAENRDGDPRWMKLDPLWSDIVKDPRYAELLKKFGLEK